MRDFTFGLKILAVPALFIAATPAMAQSKASFSQNSRNGVCYFSVQGPNAPGTDKPMKLEFSYRVSDGNLAASILVNGWPRAQAGDPEKSIPMTVTFDAGQPRPSRSGGYSSGFNDIAWGGWGAGMPSEIVMQSMKEARTVRIEFDGMKLGPFDLQGKGLAYTSLTECADRVEAGGS